MPEVERYEIDLGIVQMTVLAPPSLKEAQPEPQEGEQL